MSDTDGSGWGCPTRELRMAALVDPESLPTDTHPNFSFRYIDIAAASEGRLVIPDAEILYRNSPSRAKRVLRDRDVIMSTVRPNLKAFAFCKLPQGNYIASTGFAVLRAIDENEPRFILYSLLSDPVARQIESFVVGSNYPAINSSDVKRLLIPAFDPPQQGRIAEILSTVDEQIEQTESLIGKLRQIKAGLMHDLFTRGLTPAGHLRPPQPQAPNLYKPSPLGWISKEWEVDRLGAILKRCGGFLQTGPFGSQLHAHEYADDGVPVVMPQDINDGVISIEAIARIVESRAAELSRHRMRLGDVVISRRGDLSRAAAIVEEQKGWLCGTGCFLLRLAGSELHAEYASAIYRHDHIQRQIAGVAVGSTMPSLNNSVMERLWFPYCGPTEQSAITERLASTDAELGASMDDAAKLRHLKHGLMHDLLTGKVRVEPSGSE